MPVIAFANPKGGAGKTTTALVLATQLASRGAQVLIIDADPERWISQWGALPGKPTNISIIGDVSEDSIVEQIDHAAPPSGVPLRFTGRLVAQRRGPIGRQLAVSTTTLAPAFSRPFSTDRRFPIP